MPSQEYLYWEQIERMANQNEWFFEVLSNALQFLKSYDIRFAVYAFDRLLNLFEFSCQHFAKYEQQRWWYNPWNVESNSSTGLKLSDGKIELYQQRFVSLEQTCLCNKQISPQQAFS